MAKSAAGKWVSRVGSTGGGKSYKKSRPSNFYGALVVIVVLGLAATVLARYEYQHPSSGKASTPPTVGTTWYAALSIDNCGKTAPFLATNPKYTGGFTVQPADVIKVSPTSSADAGNNATLAQFTREYAGLTATSTTLGYPITGGVTTVHDGDRCPAKTKYAGKVGQVSYAYWTTIAQKTPTITTDPSTIKFSQYLRVTMAFLPSGVTPPSPPKVTVDAMVKTAVTPTTTTTTTIPVTPTTAVRPTTPTTSGATTSSTVVTTTTSPKG